MGEVNKVGCGSSSVSESKGKEVFCVVWRMKSWRVFSAGMSKSAEIKNLFKCEANKIHHACINAFVCVLTHSAPNGKGKRNQVVQQPQDCTAGCETWSTQEAETVPSFAKHSAQSSDMFIKVKRHTVDCTSWLIISGGERDLNRRLHFSFCFVRLVAYSSLLTARPQILISIQLGV